jgi:hypothetical protein
VLSPSWESENVRIGQRIVHVKYASFGCTLLALSLVWVSGCAGGSSARSAWQSPSRPSFSRILIVGLSTDFDQRCSFEFALASQFSGSSTQALVSCNSMTPTERLTRANIERVVVAEHADAVLTSAVVTLQFGLKKGSGTPYYQVTGVGYVTGPLGDYGVPVAFVQLETMPSIPTVTGEIQLVTKLFDAKDATLIYSLDTQSKNDNVQSTPDAIETIAGLIGDRLRQSGVIH